MMRILLTGGTGFIGRNILPILRKSAEVDAPSRGELDTVSEESVRSYFAGRTYDVVIHAANSNPFRNPGCDSRENMLDASLRGFMNLLGQKGRYGRMLYFGSGAEYDKRFDIVMAKEEQIGAHIPVDVYGFAKYVMNELARASDNIFNLRVFGCYGPTDSRTKFIRDAIDCCLENRAVTIRQNCMFDYTYVDDIGRLVCRMMTMDLRHHDYNLCSGRRISLLETAGIVSRQMGNDRKPEIALPGWNREYTADNGRLLAELSHFEFTSMEEGIARQIAWQKGVRNEEARC